MSSIEETLYTVGNAFAAQGIHAIKLELDADSYQRLITELGLTSLRLLDVSDSFVFYSRCDITVVKGGQCG